MSMTDDKDDFNDTLLKGGDEAVRARILKFEPAKPKKKPNGSAGAQPTNAETKAEVERLAKLSKIEYDRQREPAAEKLGIRVKTLDDEVDKHRQADGDDKRGPSIKDTEPWPAVVSLAAALDSAITAYSQYLVVPDGGSEVMALWSMGTHCIREFPIFPRLAITSPVKACGKSLLLRILKTTSARSVIMTNANIAPLFRMISMCRPSIFLDEADNHLSDKPDLLALLNDGYAEGGRVWRCEGENNEVKEFDVYAAVAISMINRPAATLLSRSIEIRMQRKTRGQKTVNFRGDRIAPELIEVQRKFARAAIDHADALRSSDPDMGSLFNRDADNWRPLFAIADVAGGTWPKRVRELAAGAIKSNDEQSTKELLLADMRAAFEAARTDRLSSEDRD